MANFSFYSFSTKSEIFIVLSHQGIIYDTCCNYLPAEFFLPIFTYFVLWSILNKKISKILKKLYFEKFICEGVKGRNIQHFTQKIVLFSSITPPLGLKTVKGPKSSFWVPYKHWLKQDKLAQKDMLTKWEIGKPYISKAQQGI